MIKKGGKESSHSKARVALSGQKRGQITAFIIIGILLLFVIGTIFYIKFWQEQKAISAGEFEYSKEPVTAYVQACVKDIAEEGIQLIGLQGGYTEVNYDAEMAELAPFNSDVLALSNGKLLLPYWYHQRGNDLDKVTIPKLYRSYPNDYSIQDQLERYVKERLAPCITDFSSFEAQNIRVLPQTQPIVIAHILENAVEIELQMRIELQKFDTVETIETINVHVPVALKKLYSLATEITRHEIQTLFFERSAMNLVAAYSGVDDELLPPVTGGLSFESCANREFWFHGDVEKNMRSMLSANIPYIKIANTNYNEIVVKDRFIATKEDKIRQGVFDNLVAITSEKTYPGVNTDIRFDSNFPLNLEFGNNVGRGLLEPQAMEVDLIFAKLCMFDYSYLYNLEFPILVALTDENSWLDNQPFMFQFPLQVVIKNNFPRVKLNDVLQGILPDLEEKPSHQCSPQQKISKESSVTVVDRQGRPINDASVVFQCGPDYVDSSNVETGETSRAAFGEICFVGATEGGSVEEKYPPCRGGGMVTATHLDYVEKSAFVGDVGIDQGFDVELVLDRVYEKKVKVRKFFVKPPAPFNSDLTIENPGIVLDDNGNPSQCNIHMEQKSLQPYEKALINLEKIDLEDGILNTAPMAVYEQGVEGDEEITMKIAPGRYKVDITLLRNERYPGELTISKESEAITVPEGFFGAEKTIRYPDEDVLVDQMFTGGVEMIWEVTDADLRSNEAILFYVIDEDAPESVHELGTALNHRAGCAELNYNILKPRMV